MMIFKCLKTRTATNESQSLRSKTKKNIILLKNNILTKIEARGRYLLEIYECVLMKRIQISEKNLWKSKIIMKRPETETRSNYSYFSKTDTSKYHKKLTFESTSPADNSWKTVTTNFNYIHKHDGIMAFMNSCWMLLNI